MPGSNRQLNWTQTTFTPLSGSPVTIDGVQSIQINQRTEVIKAFGDGNYFAVAANVVHSDPQMQIQTQNVRPIIAFGMGARGSVSSVLNDAVNGTGSGAVTVVMNPAIVTDKPIGGQHAQYAAGSLMFDTYSADGFTPTVSYTVAV